MKWVELFIRKKIGNGRTIQGQVLRSEDYLCRIRY